MSEMKSPENSPEKSPEMLPEYEKRAVFDSLRSTEALVKQGDVFYLLSYRWFHSWLEYVNQRPSAAPNDGSLSEHQNSTTFKRPSAINNSDLIKQSDENDAALGFDLREHLVEGTDFIVLPEEIWKKLHAWYGGGPTLARKIISSGLLQTELSVEVYPLRLHLNLVPKGDRSTIRISKKETVGELHKKACEIFGLQYEQACIWNCFGRHRHALMNDLDRSLEAVNIDMDQNILVDITDKSDNMTSVQGDGSGTGELMIFVDPSKNQTTPREVEMRGVSTKGSSRGLTGLWNLGNTCYMNSAIQCLVHTPEFASYFLKDYQQEINWHNPLGNAGNLAVAFGDLLRKLWSPGRKSVSPRPFKSKLSRFAKQFNGYDQHDSQEFLAFLLDGLHEDLNHVKDNPNFQSRDADGRPDEEVADEYWQNHVARNSSIIVDVCQGQYKSTLVCPACNRMSVTFDPLMYLSLPLEFTPMRTMTVTVFTSDGSLLPAAFTVNVPKHGLCRDLLQALSKACCLKDKEKIILVKIQNHLINCFLEGPLVPLSFIKEDDHLAAYKIEFAKKFKFLQLIHRREKEIPGSSQRRTEWKPYGIPLVSSISCDDTITRGDIQAVVNTMLSPLLRRTENLRHADVLDTSTTALDPPQAVNCTGATTESILGETEQESDNSNVAASRKLPLLVVDKNNSCIDLSVGEEKAVNIASSSRSIPVFVNWFQKLLDDYETTYMENLPAVKDVAVTKTTRDEALSLYTCLEAFLREEPLVPEDMWYCPQCKKPRQASKKLDLWRLPEVLVIHLKRFSYSKSTEHKLETFVHFPMHNFDLTNYVGDTRNSMRQPYELYALINHYGGMGSGHYTAHIKLFDENRWYKFDDTHVSPISEDEVCSAAAYLLFYRKVKTEYASATNLAQSSAGPNNVASQQ